MAVAAWSDVARGSALLVAVVALVVVLATLHGRAIAVALVLGSRPALRARRRRTDQASPSGALVAAFFIFTVRASLWLLGIVKDLDEASHVKAQLAVVEERLRFSRDVHDVLGRRLSTIAVQAELAATLAARGDERAAERMLDVRSVAHEALREARELARGYRATDFLNELDGAGSLLRSAGIEVRVSVDAMPRAWHEAAGWVVRESVTNVLRHSNASRRGDLLRRRAAAGRQRRRRARMLPPAAPACAGCASGSRRSAPRSRAGPDGDGRWVVVAQLPGSGPLSANHKEGLPS